jgi:vitamin B12 transporter
MHHRLVPSPARHARRLSAPRAALAALALVAGLHAQTPSAPSPLPSLVVTATRVPTPAEETAAAVTVITREQIERAQFGDALAALKTVPGLSVTDGGMPGQAAGIFLRGTETRHTAILLDGRRLPTGLQRYFDLGYFPLGNVARIEVARGPLGAAQGGGALGGAVNFITQRDTADGVSGTVAGDYGTFATRHAEVGVTAARNGVSASVGGAHFATDNRRPNSAFAASSTLNTFGWQITPAARLELLAGWLRRDGGNPGAGTQTMASDLDERLEQELWFLAPSLIVKTGEAWTHTVDFSLSRQRSVADNTQFFSDNTTTVRTRGLAYQAEFRPSDELVAHAGVERGWQDAAYAPGAGNFALPFARNEQHDAVFAGVQFKPLAGLTLLASARRDDYAAFYGAANTWRYGASYRVAATGTVLHAADGTAFAAPEVQNFVDFGFGPLAATLRPERARGQEVGVTQELLDGKLKLSATAFQSKTTDLVQFDFLSFTAKNIGLARMRGVETSAEWRFAATGALTVGYTYLEARDAVAGRPLQRRPRHTFSAELRGEPLPGWTLGAGLRGVSDREDTDPVTFIRAQQPGYMVARVFTHYDVNASLRLRLRVENALNKRYSETAGYPALPLSVHGGVEWRF